MSPNMTPQKSLKEKLKFKARHKKIGKPLLVTHKKGLFGYLCINAGVMVWVEYGANNAGGYDPVFMRQLDNPEVDELDVLQFVCCDKHGKEIYGGIDCNGDKVKGIWHDSGGDTKVTGHVVWSDDFLGWKLQTEGFGYRLSGFAKGQIELIEPKEGEA